MYVRAGEIVGIAGLVGAGKTELCKTLFGALPHTEGCVKMHDKEIHCNSPLQAVKSGLALVPEERRKEGVLISEPVCENITIAALQKYCNLFSMVNRRKEKKDAIQMIKDLGIKTPSENQAVALLSGGNQQKVVFSKCIFADPDILFLDEPTRGIDVGAKYEIYTIINELAEKGKSVVMISSELPELLGMCDRIYVMNRGMIVGELMASEASQERIMQHIMQSNKEIVK